MLRDDEQSGTRSGRDEVGEVPRHGSVIVSHQDTSRLRRLLQHLWVGKARQFGSDSRLEVNGWFPPKRGQDNDLIEICVGLKADGHEGAACIWRLASASFR